MLSNDEMRSAAEYLSTRWAIPLVSTELPEPVLATNTVPAEHPLSPAAHAASMQAGGSSSTAEPAAVHSNAELLKELERKMEELNEIKKMLAKGETQPAPAAHAGANTGVAPSTPKAEAQARSQQPPVTPAAEPPAVTASAPSAEDGEKCFGGDAFEGQSVDKWTPPRRAELASIQKWEDAHEAMLARLKSANVGGQILRDMIHKEVRALRLLRHNLFCKYA